ncbi:DUF6503 family protein [Winogradskyella bathintestinalis]|uniref:Threonine synthase n=1 Tax=Winogradskyella bathintestinalis TaxID=3035208 RepID=A0ABT7ZWM8_9FLAO|nr:DUF6503 family protein [Winogradskyella bathintestinalis]MDN3493407.1 hypothetical protein [Winogradskyella bathintestinalis]
MKKFLQLLIIAITISACKNDPKSPISPSEKNDSTTIMDTDKKEIITTSIYPESISKVFEAHGGIDQWHKMNSLSFTMEKPNGKEVTTTNLKTRAELINTPTYTQGFDGKTLWVKEKDNIDYQGKPKFYKGLMMYFYAMPFIVGDDGINYKETEPLVFEDKTYPGILISFEAGIGESPNDTYVIYYDSETRRMEWLAYTVTYGKEQESQDYRFIRYNNWQTVNGLLIPKSIDWYEHDNKIPTEKRNTVEFTDVILSETILEQSQFLRPEDAKEID